MYSELSNKFNILIRNILFTFFEDKTGILLFKELYLVTFKQYFYTVRKNN